MNPSCKKFVSLLLVFSLMMLSINLYAKERRGAKLSVIKKGGQKIEGELITIKENSLLLLESESGTDVSVYIKDITEIRIVKKAPVKTGLISGLIIGVIVGTLTAVFLGIAGEEGGIGTGLLIAGGSTLTGAVITFAVAKAIEKRYVFTAMTDLEIRDALDKLRKKARIRNYK